MNDSLVFEVELALPFDDAMDAVEKTLKMEGFGILTRVDVQTTFKEKINKSFRPFCILGACNPHFAFRLLEADPKMGLLLPCKLTVEAVGDDSSLVRFINPKNMVVLELGDDPVIAQVADEAERSIRQVVQTLENLEN